MTDDLYFETYNRKGEGQDAYFAEVEKRTRVPLKAVVDSIERLGMKLTMCIDFPDAPVPDDKKATIFAMLLTPERAGVQLCFSLPKRSVSGKASRRKREGG
jgi:hypothetical protein